MKPEADVTIDADEISMLRMKEIFSVANMLLLNLPCEKHEGKTVLNCRNHGNGECSMCKVAIMNQGVQKTDSSAYASQG